MSERYALKNNRILVVGLNWLGDCVMSLPAIERLASSFPDSEITVLCKKNLAEIYSSSPAVSVTVNYSGAGPVSTVQTGLRLRPQCFALCVVLPRSYRTAFCAFLSGAQDRIGYANAGRGLLLTKTLDRGKFLKIHRVDYYLNLLSLVGCPTHTAAPKLSPSAEMVAQAGNKLLSAGIKQGDLLVGICPGAVYGTAKRWDPERFAGLASSLARKHSAKLLFFGNSAERKLAEDIIEAVSPKGSCVNLTGATGLMELAALAAKCKVFVTNDTGAMHVASAVGTHVVAIFGPTDTVSTPPYGMNRTIVTKDLECAPCLKRECPRDRECMTAISVDEVYEAVRKRL